jgi:hypothetical protein
MPRIMLRFVPIKMNATDCASLEAIGALGCIKIRSALAAYNLGAHHQAFSHSISMGTNFVYAMDMKVPVGYTNSVRHG